MNSLTILTITNRKNSNEGYELLKQEKEKISFLNPEIVLIDDCESYAEYNYRCVCKLDEYFETDYCLNVEFDGRIINPKMWTNNFFNYDYIGAPWKNFKMLMGFDSEINQKIKSKYSLAKNFNDYFVGNGGFSLRSKNLTKILKEKITNYFPINNCILNEDVFICLKNREMLENLGIKFAPFEIAKKFSVESDEYKLSFGGHRHIYYNYKWLQVKDINKPLLGK